MKKCWIKLISKPQKNGLIYKKKSWQVQKDILESEKKKIKIKTENTYWSITITSLDLVCVLASLKARSLASEPELTKKQTFRGSGIRLVSLSAYSTRLSCRKREFVFSTRSCWLATSAIFGWLWPTENGGFSYNENREHHYNKYRGLRCLCSQDISRPFHWTCIAPVLIIFSEGQLWRIACMMACRGKFTRRIISRK